MLGREPETQKDLTSLALMNQADTQSMTYQQRFQRHFPCQYKQLQKTHQQTSDPSFWEREFKRHFVEYYQSISQYIPENRVNLLIAAKDGNLEKIKTIPLQRIDIHWTAYLWGKAYWQKGEDSCGGPAYWASINHAQDVLNYFYQACLNRYQDQFIDDTDTIGYTRLHHAAALNQCDQVIPLLQQSAAIDAKSKDGWTPLHCAAYNGHLANVKILIESNADIEAELINHDTPLHLAIQNGHLAIVEELLAKNANVNTEKPLLIAAEQDELIIFDKILEYSINLAECKNKIEKSVLLAVIDKVSNDYNDPQIIQKLALALAHFELIEYKTSAEKECNNQITFFNSGENVVAANALISKLIANENIDFLSTEHPALTEGNLGKIYQQLQHLSQVKISNENNNTLAIRL